MQIIILATEFILPCVSSLEATNLFRLPVTQLSSLCYICTYLIEPTSHEYSDLFKRQIFHGHQVLCLIFANISETKSI